MMPTLMRAYGSLLSQPGTQPEPQAQAHTNNRQNGFLPSARPYQASGQGNQPPLPELTIVLYSGKTLHDAEKQNKRGPTT